MTNILNVPNLLTILRILLVFPLVYFLDNTIISGTIFLIAALSDYIDGWWARKFDQRTVFGSFLDPIADKILLISGLSILSYLNVIDLYILISFIVLEFLIAGFREFMARQGEVESVRPNWISNRKIDFQFSALTLLFYDVFLIGEILLYVALIFTFMSFVFKVLQSKPYCLK
jgi:CDP-diacylglycerol--glycerol-3-phosphate 3-phosphatidyltransferase